MESPLTSHESPVGNMYLQLIGRWFGSLFEEVLTSPDRMRFLATSAHIIT
jgi:hypothetical protein